MVGTTGFEPATSRTPSVRATRLRHVPTTRAMSVSLAFEKGQDSEKLLVQIEQEFAMRARCRFATSGRGWRFGVSLALRRRRVSAAMTTCEVSKMLAGAGDRETLFIEQALDFKNGFDVVAAVEAMAARTFYRLQSWEFRFPVAQDESFCRRQAAHFADAKKALLRNFGRGLSAASHGFSVSYYYRLRVRNGN